MTNYLVKCKVESVKLKYGCLFSVIARNAVTWQSLFTFNLTTFLPLFKKATGGSDNLCAPDSVFHQPTPLLIARPQRRVFRHCFSTSILPTLAPLVKNLPIKSLLMVNIFEFVIIKNRNHVMWI